MISEGGVGTPPTHTPPRNQRRERGIEGSWEKERVASWLPAVTVFVQKQNLPPNLLSILDKMGFAEVCVKCCLPVALARNSLRPTPIPDPTIVAMGDRLEPPHPAQHHWEKRSFVLENNSEGEGFTVEDR